MDHSLTPANRVFICFIAERNAHFSGILSSKRFKPYDWILSSSFVRLFFCKNMDKRWLICAKEDVFVFVEEEKELAKIKAIIPGSERRQLKVRVN